MNLLTLFIGKGRKKRRAVDFYQASINKLGKKQLQGLIARGLSVPVIRI